MDEKSNNTDMKLLLVVGAANDIFIYNYAKWLKKSMNISIDVFEFYPSEQQGYGKEFYDHVETAKGLFLPFRRGKDLVDDIARGRDLKVYLKNKYYDAIHCHWIVPPFVLQNKIKNHCKKLFLTFWGGEFCDLTILRSKKIYRHYLKRLSKQTDCIINNKNSQITILNQLPFFKGAYKSASYGSAPLEALYNLMQNEDKATSKQSFNISSEKLTVQIGYSGKPLHQHLQIIAELKNHNELKRKIHILAPMTRGADTDYIKKVKSALDSSGYEYTLLSNRFLSDYEVAQIRNATDIALQFSTFDTFSNSIIECLCAKAIVIYGDWLGYEHYMEPSGYTGIEVSNIENGISKLIEVVENVQSFSSITERNHNNGRHQGLCSECIIDWINAYNDILN